MINLSALLLISWAFMSYLFSLFVKSLSAEKKNKENKNYSTIITILYAVGIIEIIGIGTAFCLVR